MDADQEIVYRTSDDSHIVMSEKVQSLAGSVYQEFEKMISKYDHDVVKDLMPLVVNVLECLDSSYSVNQEHEVELELLREDNEQLVTQYEREKQLRKSSEQKLLEVEDLVEDERKNLSCKIESLESIVRMLELKSKNSADHVFRLEEKELENKKEYQKLHERYTELFKTHMDYMERTKIMQMSTNSERLEPAATARTSRMPSLGLSQMNRSSGPVSFGFQSLEEMKPDDPSLISDDLGGSPHDSTASNTSLKNELNETNAGDVSPAKRKPWSNDSSEVQSPEPDEPPPPVMGKSTTKSEQRSGNTLYQELSFQDHDGLGDPEDGDVTGSWVHPGEYASSGWKSLHIGITHREVEPANDNFFGMGKEVENLILENNELLATKNALNIVKDDLILKVDELTSEQEVLREEMSALHAVKDRLKQKVSELEEELKRVKEEAAKQMKSGKSDDEDEDIPMAQRKRFTRVEMARVLMERNQYKERFMELQEAVRWTEAIRATKSDVSLDKAKNKGVWKYFSSLFGMSSEKEMPPRRGVGVMYASPYRVSPSLPASQPPVAGDRKRPIDYLDRGAVSSEKLAARKALERREQYRQVRAHVRKEDGRLQAYGWSLPARVPAVIPDPGGRPHVPVPVPVYCQPLATSEEGAKVWCAAGVNLSGGKTKDGGNIVGGSVFYAPPNESDGSQKSEDSATNAEDTEPHITKLEEELKEGEKVREEGETLEQRLSPQVWICSSTRNESRVSIVDAIDPANVLESFLVCQSYLLCIASVPGATEADYRDDTEPNNNITKQTTEPSKEVDDQGDENENLGRVTFVVLLCDKVEGPAPAGEDEPVADITQSSVLPTMWLGAQNGYLYIHSAVGNRSKSIASVHMPDSVLCITHCVGRVLVALANGTVAVFQRSPSAEWDLSQYFKVQLGDPQASVRCMSLVHSTVWCGYKNKIHILDPVTLALKKSLEAHPRKESQVRQLAWLGDGVWVSIRLDSTLRLYHAHTYQHLQDVDIEPYVSKMLGTGKLGFSFVRITALLVSTGRLWIGTGNGVIISVPLSEDDIVAHTSGTNVRSPDGSAPVPGSIVRVYKDAITNKVTPGSFIPYCSMSEAQLSFHGHRDAVKFFVAVPGSKVAVANPHMLVMSGGEGYVDFRNGDGSEDEGGTIPEEPEVDGATSEYDALRNRKHDMSHLVIWQVALPPS